MIGLLNAGTAVGRPVIGILSDRWSQIDTAGALTMLCGLSCFIFWLPATSFGLTVFFCHHLWGYRWGLLDGTLDPRLVSTLHGARSNTTTHRL